MGKEKYLYIATLAKYSLMMIGSVGIGRHKNWPQPSRKRRRQSTQLKHQPQCCDGSEIDGCYHHHHHCSNGRTFVAVYDTEMIELSNVKNLNRRRCRRIPCTHLVFTLQILLLWSTASIIFAKSSDLRLPTASFITQSSSSSFATRHCIHNNLLFERRRRPNYTMNIASLFVSIQNNPSTTERGVMKDIRSEIHIGSHDNSDDCDDSLQNQQPISLHPMKLQSKLSSFSSNINRYRMLKKRLENTQEDVKANDDALIGACNSLYYFLHDETDKLSSSASLSSTKTILQWDVTMIESIQTMLESALIQSIRGTSDVGDFVLLNKLVHVAVDYATAISKIVNSTETKGYVAILSPRIFGEAITSLSKISKASLSKIKSLWNFFIYDTGPFILSSPPSSYELNAMLLALRERKKVSAALKLYRQTSIANEKMGMKGDSYTASILFGMMADSISSGGLGGKDTSSLANEDESPTSPCWQWNEAMSLLDTFNEPYQLNNYAYAAIFKVNECAALKYRDGNNRHNGVKCAMYVLERMKVREYHTYCACFDIF